MQPPPSAVVKQPIKEPQTKKSAKITEIMTTMKDPPTHAHATS
jgi:hypothetical protein